MKGSRKLTMMKWSYISVSALGVVYMYFCSRFSVAPDATVMMVIFGALGGGHATANLANGMEHKNSD